MNRAYAAATWITLCLVATLERGSLMHAQGVPTGAARAQLQVYFIDVEGGQATLFVTPEGESLLIDTGWPGSESRDAARIAAATKAAGLKKIDYVLITHYHADHVGGVPQLVERIPVGTFIDHGENRELDGGQTERGYAAYRQVLATGRSKRLIVRPGDVLPLRGMTATVVSADGNVLGTPLRGAGQANASCESSATASPDVTENARSLGIEIDFGRLRILDLGDLTADKERQLMCPINKIGRVDISVVSHHGARESSSAALVDAIHARVAIMDNGATKGGSLSVFKTLAKAPGLETLWQLHFSDEAGTAQNTAAAYIANTQGPDAGNFLKLTAGLDGSFEVLNSRTGAVKRYAASATRAVALR